MLTLQAALPQDFAAFFLTLCFVLLFVLLAVNEILVDHSVQNVSLFNLKSKARHTHALFSLSPSLVGGHGSRRARESSEV